MILSDQDIRERLDDGDLEIDYMSDPDQQIQPATVDVRLSSAFREFTGDSVIIRPSNGESGTMKLVDTWGDEYVIAPGDFVLGTTVECVSIPDDLIGHVEGRSSLGRLGIQVHATAGIIDSGYQGQITLELSNVSNTAVALKPGMRISQLSFTELSSPAERPYGEERGSKYQGQRGPQASKLDEDVEFN